MSLLSYLSSALLISKSDIVKYSATAPHRYKIYEIPKRNSNKKRVIAHPASELKFIQRCIVKYLEPKFELHPSAYAYRKNLSIKDNAIAHQGTKFLLKMDFEDFFPSITPELLFGLLQSEGVEFDKNDRKVMSGLLFCKYVRSGPLVLSIGAPSSPLISNIIMSKFDEHIHSICLTMKINYTRYADDITFSSNEKNVLFKIPLLVEQALDKFTQNKIKINASKTVYSSKRHNRHVTGITLTNDDKLSVGRERKRLISSMIHRFINKKLSNESIKLLQGYLSHASYIEPEFYERMVVKYGEENISTLVKFTPK